MTARVKQLEEGGKAWRKNVLNRYADIANKTWQMESIRVQKEHDIQLGAMRAKYEPRLDARTSVEGQIAASLAQARQDLRLAAAGLVILKEANEAIVEVERERNELRATVDELRAENGALRVVEGEGRKWKGKSMQQAQALENERVTYAKTQGHVVKLKEGKEKPKARAEGGEEEATVSDRTIYRRATALADVIVDVFENNVGISGRLWHIMMMKKTSRTHSSRPASSRTTRRPTCVRPS